MIGDENYDQERFLFLAIIFILKNIGFRNRKKRMTTSDCLLHISNLPDNVDEEFLRSTFESCGNILKIVMKKRSFSNIAIIQYENAESVRKAISTFNYNTLSGKQLVLTSCDRDTVNSIRQGMSSIQVSNLPEGINSVQLAEVFSNFGEVITVKVAESDLKKGVAFIQYKNRNDAYNAREQLENATLGENEIQLEEYYPRLRIDPTENKMAEDKTYTDIFIKGLPPTIKTPADLGALLLEFGELEGCRLIDGEDCAIARMKTHEMAENVVKNMTGRTMAGRILTAFRVLSKAERHAYNLREHH